MDWQFIFSPWFFALWFLLAGTVIAMNARDRMRQGPVHPPFAADDVLFHEKRASGASERNWSTRIGGASNALEVMVLRQGLVIQPNAVIRWMMRRNFNDLEHFIPHANVIRVEPDRAWGRERIRVEFRDAEGSARSLILFLKYREQFLAAISRATAGSTT